MLRRLHAPVLLNTFFALGLSLTPSAARQTVSERFDLRGKVINAATGEPVSGALVQVSDQESLFTQSDGSFVFTNLPRGQVALAARKPGFFNDRELGHSNPGMFPMTPVPFEGDAIVKLTPEGIIFGQVKNENGEPMDEVAVRAERWQVLDGRRQLQIATETRTDDEGNFRLAELLPGNYYLAFVPVDGGMRNDFRRKKQGAEGYGLQFYPGSSDVAGAIVLQVRPGTQLRMSQMFGRQHLFEVAGIVSGTKPEDPFQISFVSSSGDAVMRNLRLNPKTGRFQITGVPPGSYMLTATSFQRGSDGQVSYSQPLTAMLPIHVSSDLSGLVLSLGAGISAAVQLRDEVQGNASPNNFHQVVVRMIPKEFPQYAPAISVPPSPDASRAPVRIEGLAPGTYSVEATSTGAGYIASLRCGSVDLLKDDLTIAPGSAPPPIEVILRNDSPQLTVALENGMAAGVVIYSQEYSRRSLAAQIYNGTISISGPNLAPGIYQVFAVNDVSELEFRNPIAVERYLKHAKVVSLQPGDNASVRVMIQQSAESQQ